MQNHYSVTDTAILIAVHRKTVEKWIKSGKIKAINISTGKIPRYRIPESEINRIAQV